VVRQLRGAKAPPPGTFTPREQAASSLPVRLGTKLLGRRIADGLGRPIWTSSPLTARSLRCSCDTRRAREGNSRRSCAMAASENLAVVDCGCGGKLVIGHAGPAIRPCPGHGKGLTQCATMMPVDLTWSGGTAGKSLGGLQKADCSKGNQGQFLPAGCPGPLACARPRADLRLWIDSNPSPAIREPGGARFS